MATFSLYNSAVEYIGDGTFDMDNTDAWSIALVQGTYVPDTDHTTFNDVTNAKIAVNATANVAALAGEYWNRSTNTVTFGSDAVTFTASGGLMNADIVVIYQDAAGAGTFPVVNTDKLLGFSNIGVQSIADGADLTVRNAGNTAQAIWFTQKSV